jgi:membrane protein YqaA with SNARE-associated domain
MGALSYAISNKILKQKNDKNLIERLYTSILKLADTRWSKWLLFICAFADASFLPLPVTTIFLFLILMDTRIIVKYVFIIVAGTLAGALAGFAIGHYAWIKPDGEFTGLAHFLFNIIPGFSAEVYEKVHSLFTKWDFWILCAATATPLPYGMFAVSSGVFEINIFIFFLATLISQGIKFSFLGLIAIKAGPRITKLMKLKLKPAIISTTV